MSIEDNVQIVKDFFAAMGGGDKLGLLALVAEDIEWIIPGEDWPLAGHAPRARGIGGCASEGVRRGGNDKPPEFVAQGDRVLVIGVATGKIKVTNRTFKDDWVFAITVRNGKVTKIREYIGHASTGAGLRDGCESRALTHRHRYHTKSMNTLNSGNTVPFIPAFQNRSRAAAHGRCRLLAPPTKAPHFKELPQLRGKPSGWIPKLSFCRHLSATDLPALLRANHFFRFGANFRWNGTGFARLAVHVDSG